MSEIIRGVLADKLEEIREHEPHCTIQWSDTKKLQVIAQEYIRLLPSQEPQINVTYTIFIDDVRRHGTVIAVGTKKYCEFVQHKLSPHDSRVQPADSPISVKHSSGNNDSDLLDDILLMRILGKLLNNVKSDDNKDNGDVHDAECASCRMKPIRGIDRYRCLECSSTPGYDLCGRCFEKRCETGRHFSGHAMIHFKLPNEFLGIHINNVDQEISLNKLKNLNTLQNEQHQGYTCDGDCRRKNFIGLRFKCDICPNYNLCEICAIMKRCCTKMHERDHPIILTSDRVLPKIDSTDIEIGEVLGSGAFGYVCKAIWRSKNRQVACKVIEVSGVSAESSELQRSFLHELAAYRELSGPYILRTFGYATRELESNRIRGPKTHLMIIMELMECGSLHDVIKNESNKISLRRKLVMLCQIASGMRRIHQHGMIHRDIRPDNILVTNDYLTKIGDMGIARVFDPTRLQSKIGCREFMPPEFYDPSPNGDFKYDQKLDIYTFGLTMNEFLTETMHDFDLNKVPRMTITKQSIILYDEIISRCLENDSKRRPTAIEIEKTLQLYEQAFSETMLTDAYTRMNTREKDRIFIEFYQKNKLCIQRFIREQFPSQFIQEIPIEFSPKQARSVSYKELVHDVCRPS